MNQLAKSHELYHEASLLLVRGESVEAARKVVAADAALRRELSASVRRERMRGVLRRAGKQLRAK